MTSPHSRHPAEETFEEEKWADAYARLSSREGATDPDPSDLDRLGTAAYMAGRYGESTDAWTRAYRAFMRKGEVERALRSAFWLIYGLINRGKRARAAGWMARALRLLDDAPPDCVERGYLLLHQGFQRVTTGDVHGAYQLFSDAAEIAERCNDADLIALARHSRGRVRIRMGSVDDGVRLLDEAMATAEAETLSPLVVGDVYCSVIEGCMEIYDLRRAREWTAALSDWWASQPDLVPFSGQCLVYRAELLQLHGAWLEAADAAEEACERLTRGSGVPAAGEAFYRRAEIHRLQGHFDRAEDGYREANKWGRSPHPGLARLRLYQDRADAAEAAIRRAVNEAHDRPTRSRLLPADVEISLAVGKGSAARTAMEELQSMAEALDAPYLRAVAAHARGAVLLEEGSPGQALPPLRRAWDTWTEIQAPYETARVRVLIARACSALGDADTAKMEIEAARWMFERLEAAPELERMDRRRDASSAEAPGDLTDREVQVLRLAAEGRTNREIADALFISAKTVARHMSNIFSKLDVPNRAAATAYAYEHDLM